MSQRMRLTSVGEPTLLIHSDLLATAQAQHQVERGFLLDVVVGQRAAVLELLAREDQALLPLPPTRAAQAQPPRSGGRTFGDANFRTDF